MEPEQAANQPAPEVAQPLTALQGDPLQTQDRKRWLIMGGIVLVVILATGVGVLGYQNFTAKQQSQPSLAPRSLGEEGPPAPPPVPGETSTEGTENWKTYANTEYKFSFKYPPAYTIVTESVNPSSQKLFSFVIQNPNPRPGGGYPQPYVEAVVYEKDASNLDEWVTKHTTALPFDDPTISGKSLFYFGVTNRQESLLGGKRAITFKASSFSSSPNPTFVLWEGHIVGLVLDSENESKDPDLINTFYPQILSTFRFD